MSPLKVTLVAAETWTAAGIWSQYSGVASKSWQPLKQLPNAGCCQVPVMKRAALLVGVALVSARAVARWCR